MKTNNQIIIENSSYLPLSLRIRDIVLTALCWLLYLYFIRDALGFFADLGSSAMAGFKDIDDYPSLVIVPTLIQYIELIIASNIVYFLWAYYNKLRYGNKRRRRSAPVVTPEEIAVQFKLNPRDVVSWQKTKTLVVHHDADGRITSVMKVQLQSEAP